MTEKEKLERNIKELNDELPVKVSIYQESNLYTLSLDGISIVTTKGPSDMTRITDTISAAHKIINSKIWITPRVGMLLKEKKSDQTHIVQYIRQNEVCLLTTSPKEPYEHQWISIENLNDNYLVIRYMPEEKK